LLAAGAVGMTGAAETGTNAPIRKLAPTRPTIIFLKVFIPVLLHFNDAIIAARL